MLAREVTSTYLTKDELKDSKCCRFCGYGANREVTDCTEFTSMYGKPQTGDGDNDTKTLDVLINKYLPIKVSEKELYYPQVICSECKTSIIQTVAFFEKIIRGQKILARIINEVNNFGSGDSSDVKPNEIDQALIFSEENPVLAAPKRRGRPRRDPNKPKVQSPAVTSEYLELKPKRQSRPPVRYEPGDSKSMPEVVIKQEVEDAPAEVCSKENDEFLSQLGLQPNESIAQSNADVGNILNVSSDYTSLTPASIMDISKLSVIMDGDEEIDPQISQNNQVGITHSKLDGIVSNSVDNSSLSAGVTDESGRTSVSANLGDDDGVSVVEELHKTEDGNDSDASVKTVDFVVAKKKRRGRRKVRRKLKKLVQCEVCNKEFSHTSSLAYHRASAHAEEKKFVCEICGKGFTHKQLLVNHTYVHSDEKVFKCSVCPARFKSRASLYTHNKSIHTAKNAYTCPQCGSKFNLKSSLKAHLRLHTGEKPFACEYCNKRFAQRSNYCEHRRIHTGERPYKCDVPNCAKAFTTASQLRSHKMTHSGSKQFLCSVCGRGFTHAENFKYHMRRHNGEKPLECQSCLKPFTDPASLSKHLREKHAGVKTYACEVCNLVLPDVATYTKHKMTHDEDVAMGDTVTQDAVVESNSRLTTEIEVETEAVATEVPTQVIEAPEQVVEHVGEYQNDGGYVQILNAEDVEGGQETQQVIYLYPEELSYYTITLAENQDALEGRPSDENLQGLGNSITFAAVDAEIAAQYFNLENVAGTTITVPATSGGSTDISRSGTTPEISTYFIESKVDQGTKAGTSETET